MNLPNLSIAARLYTIFALLAAATIALAAVAVVNSLHNAALGAEVQAAYQGTLNVERVDGLIYAVVMESRGIYMTPDSEKKVAKAYGDGLIKFNDRIGEVVKAWQQVVRDDDATRFAEFSKRIQQFQEFRRELVRRGLEISTRAGRDWGDNDDNRNNRKGLNKDIEDLAKVYDARLRRLNEEFDQSTRRTPWILGALAAVAVMLAIVGGLIIRRAVARPLAKLTRVTERVATGATAVTIPFGERHDEIGGLARSIGVFQDAMRRNEELGRKVAGDAQARAERQEQIAAEIDRFGAEVEATVAELGRLSDTMADAAARLASAADQASSRTEGAAAASTEASSNVRDIASASEELSTSVGEIDRQVTHFDAIAAKAVSEAERTNAEIKALDDAAKRIGDVVELITAIAEQTNLLALNATIEAARAGDAGRGFAVVASEVKALAGQTARATEEISSHISGMQQATVRSVDAIAAIQRTIREVGGIAGTIAAAVREQGSATREIARGADVASKRTVETADEVGRVSEATADTRTSAKSVNSVAVDLGLVAGRVRSQVDGFFQRLRA